MKRPLVLMAAAALVVGSPAGAVSLAEEHRAVAGPGGVAYGYLTPTITISKGDKISFTNLDAFEHDFVHDVETDGFGGKRNVRWCKEENGHDQHDHGCPVFWSERLEAGETTKVLGLKRVKRDRTYTFFCTLHHNMKGTLIVRP